MGLGDKFKDLKTQAQKSVADHREQIDDAVGVIGMAVDKKTKGRHTQRIATLGQKASEMVDKFGSDAEAEVRSTPAPSEPAVPGSGESRPHESGPRS